MAYTTAEAISASHVQAPLRPSFVGPIVVTSPARRHLAAAPQAIPQSLESAHDEVDDVNDQQQDLLQVEAAAVADESLKISNCNLSPSTVQVPCCPSGFSVPCVIWFISSDKNCAYAFRSSFQSFPFLQALEQKGIQALFPIQKSVFDPAMAGTDLVARARTGSGKTLAFSLPIIEALLKQNREDGAGRGRRAPRAIILAPTRELAKQVAAELESATSKRDISVLTVYGGTPIGSQIRKIEEGVDVLVGTPGRVIDLVDKRQCVVLDPN